MKRVVVVGAGIGGLTAAAVLARHGVDVTVLEAHIYPGGCAGTFYHQGYRFDAGATVAGGFDTNGPINLVARATGAAWVSRPSRSFMTAHLPNQVVIERSTHQATWQAQRSALFGEKTEEFWRWQESTADALWKLALRSPAWPPSDAREAGATVRTGLGWLAGGVPAGLPLDAFRSVAARLPRDNPTLRQFIDGQLLIASQATSEQTNALFGAAALDLPRRGVVHLEGGMGAIGRGLANAVAGHGGQVLYRRRATAVRAAGVRRFTVETARCEEFPADVVLLNLPDGNIEQLLAPDKRPEPGFGIPPDGWGAFTAYVGLENCGVPIGESLHHQIIAAEPLGEGNSAFLSFSPAWDEQRAPSGMRCLTISTHTRLQPWWQMFEHDRPAYEERKRSYLERVLEVAGQALPGLRAAVRFALPGTPVTFQRFTGRRRGWVGGYPQTNLFRARPAQISDRLWRVGDSIFPGQSTAAVALGGLRVAAAIERSM